MKIRSNPFQSSVALATSIVFCLGTFSNAANFFWDGSDTVTSDAQGGNGSWETNSTSNWWNGSSNVVWPNTGTDNDTIFGGTAGTVTIDAAGVAVNDMLFNTTGYVLSGAGSITLNGSAPSVTLGSGISGTISSIVAGSAGLTKAGAGTLTLNGTTANTFTGGLNVNGGTLALNFSNFGGSTPFNNLVSSSNILTLGGGTLSVTGKNTGVTSQTFASTVLNSGASTITLAQNGGTSTTLQLGAITRNVGATLNFSNVPSTSGIIAKRGTSATAGLLGGWATVGTGPSMTYAAIDASANIVTATTTATTTSTTALITGVATSGWVTDGTRSYQTSGLATLTTARSINLYRSVNAGTTTFSLGDTLGSNFSVNGFMNTGSGVITIQRGTAANHVLAGSALDLVFTGPTGITVSAPIANNGSTAGVGGSASAVTYSGTSILTLSGANTYTGQTTVNSGTMTIGTNGSINSSSGIVVNGGSFIQANTATAISPALSLTNGIVDGTGTINTVNVSDSATAKITNGNGGTGALTIGNLTFSGDGIIDIRTAGSAGLNVTGTLATTAANGQVVINVVTAPAWANGSIYNLIGYGTLGGSIGDFTKGNITGLGARQTATLGTAGGFITLGIAGDSALWTGAASGAWTTDTVGTPFNWKTLAGSADTQFLTNDDVLFNDTATSTSVDITTANVSTNSVVFDNTTKSYTISSSGGYGIASGTVTKNGSNTVSLTTANTYSGSTTINAGTLHVSGSILNSSAIQINGGLLQASGGNALSNTGLVTLANTAGATFQVLGSETIGALAGGGTTGGSVVIDNEQILSLGSGTQTFGGVISGQGGLTVSGATQTLTGTNTYQGATLISSGTLEIGDGVTDGSIANTSGITTNGTLRLNLAADQNYAVGIDGTGGITKTGAGVLTLSGTNSYSGTTAITSGTVKAGSTTALGTNSAVSLSNTAGVTLDLNGNNVAIGSLTGGGANGGTVALGAANLTVNNSTGNYSGTLTGSGELLLKSGTLTLGKASPDYTGNVTLSSGMILTTASGVSNVLGPNSAGTQSLTVESGATFSIGAGNNAWSQLQNIVINGTGAAGQQAALVSTGMGFGSNQIRGLAVATNSNIFVNSNGASDQRGLGVQGALAGSGTLTITGGANSGFLSLAAATGSVAGYTSFSGNVNVRSTSTNSANAAGLISNQATALGTTANIDLGSNTYFTLGASQTIGGLSSEAIPTIAPRVILGGNTLTIGSTNNLDSSFSGVISGTGGITKAGNGTLTLSNSNTYTGTTTVNAGILKAGGATAFGPAANAKLAFGPSSTGTVQLNGNSMTVIALNSDATVGTPVIENANAAPVVLSVNNSTASSYGGVLRDGMGGRSLGLTKSGSSVLKLSGDNSHSGVTTIGGTAGGIVVGANNALGTTAGNTTVAAGTSLGFSGGINYSTGETVIGSGAGSGAVGDFTATSRGFVQSVSGNNTFGGAIQINATGVTRIGTQSGAQLTLSGAITAVSGAQILIRAGETDGDFVTLSNTGNSWDTNIQIFTGNDNATQFAGLRLGADNALPTTRSISGTGTSKAATTFDMAGYNQTLNGLVSSADFLKISNTNATTSTLTLHTLQNQNTSGGTVIRDGVGKIAVVKSGAFNQILQTANTYTGGTWIKEGSIILQSGNDRLAATGTVTLGDTATTGKLVIGESGAARNQTLAGLVTSGLGGSVVGAHATNNSLLTLNIASGTNTFGGVLGGGSGNENNLALTKSGNGTLELTNTSTYTGATTVSAGTLIVNGNISTSSLTTVNGTGTLGGTGTVGDLTIAAGGSHNPGNSPGIMNTGDYTMAGSLDIEAIGNTPGVSGYDQVNVTGNINLSGTLNTSFSGGTYANGNLLFILLNDESDAVTGTFSGLAQNAFVINYGGFDWNISYTADSTGNTFTGGNDVALMAIPEPDLAALLGTLGTLALLRRRRSA